MTVEASRRPWAAAPVTFYAAVAALVLLLASPYLTWVTFGAGGELMAEAIDAGILEGDIAGADATGMDLEEGGELLTWAVLFAVPMAAWFLRGRRGRVLAGAATLFALLAFAVFFVNWGDIQDINDASFGAIEVSAGIGLWLAGAGSVLALVAGIAAFLGSQKKQPADATIAEAAPA